MATYSKIKLSNSTSGRPILIDTVTLTSGTVTNASVTSSTATYTVSNTFTAGEIVTISGIVSSTNASGTPGAGYNIANFPIASASSTQFTVASVPATVTGTWTSGGVATANPATMNTIHATPADTTTIDEVWLYATNTSLSVATLTLFYGGTATGSSTSAPNYISIPPQSGLTLITPGLILTGLAGSPATATTIFASASVASVITISGYVNRIV
jgi:hypothetical protein